MSNIPSELKFTSTHEWVRPEDDGSMTVGISDHAQALLGDLVYVELPAADTNVKSGEEVGVVESVKAASDIYSPLTGTVIAVNEELNDSPDLVNNDPYGSGWILRLQPADGEEIRDLLDAESYQEQIEAEE